VRSHLLEGRVRHRRARPFTYVLDQGVFYVALDLDEVDEVDRVPLVGHNRPAVLEFRDSDHLEPPTRDIRASVLDHLRREGMEPDGWRITLVTNFRTLGYVFNPASFYLCRDGSGALRVVIVEVHNTHLERHLYTLEAKDDGETFVSSMEKAFYVSPFIDRHGQYTVRVRDEPTRLRITINLDQDGGLLLHTSLDLARRRLHGRNVLRMLVRHPFVTRKTMAMIHWHALRLWRRGAPFFSHGAVTR
jgi:DUF1365 family protein